MIAIAGIALIGGAAGLLTLYFLRPGPKKKEPTGKTSSFRLTGNQPLIYSAAGFVLCGMLLNSVLAGCIFAVVSYFIPGFIKKRERNKRLARLNNQLVDAIGIISSSLKAGFSLLQGIDAAARRLPEPISGELETVLRENRLGVSLEESLLELSKRVASDDFSLVVTATLVSYETGGNITEVYDSIAATIRARNTMQLKLQTITSQGKLQGIIVGILPVILLVILGRIAPDMIYPLFHTFAGGVMLAAAAALELLGVFFIRKIIKVEV